MKYKIFDPQFKRVLFQGKFGVDGMIPYCAAMMMIAALSIPENLCLQVFYGQYTPAFRVKDWKSM